MPFLPPNQQRQSTEGRLVSVTVVYHLTFSSSSSRECVWLASELGMYRSSNPNSNAVRVTQFKANPQSDRLCQIPSYRSLHKALIGCSSPSVAHQRQRNVARRHSRAVVPKISDNEPKAISREVSGATPVNGEYPKLNRSVSIPVSK